MYIQYVLGQEAVVNMKTAVVNIENVSGQ